MENQEWAIDTLVEQWKTLKAHLQEKDGLDYPLFQQTFAQTYQVLSACKKETVLDKQIMPLIVSAYSFIYTGISSADFTSQAAFVLTERMLQCCVLTVDTREPQVHGVNLYIVEAFREIYLDFIDVEKTLQRLSQVIEKAYWQKS